MESKYIQKGKAVLKNVKTFKNDSREFFSKCLLLNCAQQAGCVKKPKYFENTRTDLTRVASLESSKQLANVFTNLGACFSFLLSNKWQLTGFTVNIEERRIWLLSLGI